MSYSTIPPPLNSGQSGVFSTSLCDFFSSSPSRHSDCCAFACCGLLQSDVNQHRISNLSTSFLWCKRLFLNLGIPFLTVVLVNRLGVAPLYSFITVASVILLLCFRGWYYRYQQRLQVMRFIYTSRSEQQQQQHPSEEDIDALLSRNRCNTLCATAVCGCVSSSQSTLEEPLPSNHHTQDFCSKLWNCIQCLCCSTLSRCWCQCCGMCAIGQQDREISRLHTSSNHDYVTFEPFQEYAMKLQQLRTDRVTSFWKHLCNMSKLSYKLLQLLAWSLVVLALVAVLRVERNFTLVNLLVVLATFFQAFLILYFVHWKWYRFDLSLDAVVKYFSSGFILATGMAVVLEMLVSALLGLISNVIILIVVITQDGTSLPTTSQEARDYARQFQREHLPLFCFFTFLNAFVVAAFVEETCKYFGFWMVETPDLNNSTLFGRVPKESKGVGITIAMVATALGFACCENLLYVFVYSPPSLVNEVTTLLARSIFPIHPLAAALQSIGVCRRDLEGDRKVGLGRILFPAILLHGSFDFVLMVMALIESVEDEGGGGNVSNDDDGMADDDLAKHESSRAGVQDEMPSLMASVVIVIIGLIYYVWQADAQRIRLHELDQGGRSTGETTPLLV